MRRDLDAAGIADPTLRRSYEACRRINARHGRTYYLATLLLPRHKRPYVHALYGFARHADEIVDSFGGASPAQRAERLRRWGERFLRAGTDDPIIPAVHDTIARWSIPRAHFDAFLESMRMDLTVRTYPTYADLERYMHGSAAVIGLQMLPILEPQPGVEDIAAAYARDLGVAFQLSNFIRDVGEDLRRGRVYLPMEDLDAFGVTTDDLASGAVDGRVRRLLAFQIARARSVYRAAAPGTRLLHPSSRACIETATTLYGAILDEVERAGYDILGRRVAVPLHRRASVAAVAALRARRTRSRHPGSSTAAGSRRTDPSGACAVGATAGRPPAWLSPTPTPTRVTPRA